jgi:hypothetical protein
MPRLLVPRRRRVAAAIAVMIAAGVTVFAVGDVSRAADSGGQTSYSNDEPLCVQHPQMCTEQLDPWTYDGQQYNAGHDEPSLLFYSSKAGSGNSNHYQLTLPTDPVAAPSQDGTGSTWNFQLHPAFWFGMAMCDDQSAPNPGVPCPADSDSNIKTSTDPNSPDYLGKTPGTAFMEMQFYPPGWGPISCTDGLGGQDGKWCSALTIDSDPVNMNTGQPNNPACQDSQGPEPVNWAAITKSGVPAAPANPFTPFSEQAVVTTDTLEYNNGDKLTVDMHDTRAGFQVVIHDLTTGESGSMTASVANGFGHALFEPTARSCRFQPYAFHPMYSTSSPDTRVLWAAHSYNVAYSDEIGHFEYCTTVSNFACTSSNNGTDASPDSDDFPCFTAPLVDPSGATLNGAFSGCIQADNDFDGPEYQQGTWPGSTGAVASNVSTPIVFTSPLFTSGSHGHGDDDHGRLQDYQQAAFENDLPRIEGSDFSTNNNCQRHVSNPADPAPGTGCIDPPNGATLYPTFSTFNGPDNTCMWEEGGGSFANATNNFGGTPSAEYGGLLLLNYPAAGFTITQRYNDFRNTLDTNPCPASK